MKRVIMSFSSYGATCIILSFIYLISRKINTRSKVEAGHSVFRFGIITLAIFLIGFVGVIILGIGLMFSKDFLDILLGGIVIVCLGMPLFCALIYLINTEVIFENDKMIMGEWRSGKKIVYYKDIYKIEIFKAQQSLPDRAKIYYGKKKIWITANLSGYDDLLDILLSKAKGAKIIGKEKLD